MARTKILGKRSEAKEIIIVLLDTRMDIPTEIIQRGALKKKLSKDLEIDGVHQESFNRHSLIPNNINH